MPLHPESPVSRRRAGRRRSPRRRLAVLAVLLVLYSIFQYTTTGSLSWPSALLESVTDYAGREDAAWRQAGDRIGDLGATREGRPTPAFDLRGRVVRVADGDTVSILDAGNRQHKIRLHGIDAPERDQPYGREAGNLLRKLVDDRQVGVVVVDTDSYERNVGVIYLGDQNINAEMVARGYAWWYRFHAPNERQLQANEEQARADGRGLWADSDAVEPWDWRRNRR